MNEEYVPLRYLLIGPSKSGKSTQSMTTPAPRLIIDMEGRSRFTDAGKDAVFWNGTDDPLKLPKSKSRTYILETRKIATIEQALKWLKSGNHPFISIVFDSVMEARWEVTQDFYPGYTEIPRNGYGAPNKKFEFLMRSFRDLSDKESPGPIQCVMFISGANLEIESGKIKPMIKGEIGKQIPYWMDVVAYIDVEQQKGGTPKHKSWIKQREKNDLEVGDGTKLIVETLGSPVENLSVQDMFDALQGK